MDVGTQIEQYRIVEHIGRGGMADVWSARDQRLNRMVAVKTIAHGLSQDVDPINMFKQEAQTIAQMEHPHILPIYDFGEFEGQLYIVMRYVAGGSLEDLLRRGPLPLDDALRMGQAIANALDYAHSNKIVHLDLKPPNVLLDSMQSPYLADFGLATVLDMEGKATNPGSGTLLYMAPEQLDAELLDHRADIYSFSIVLFHMLTGQLPFEATAPLAFKQLQFDEELPDVTRLNPSLPSFLNDVLRRGTSPNPDHRPQSMAEMLREINDKMAVATGLMFSAPLLGDFGRGEGYGALAETAAQMQDMELLEAQDIYNRARHIWAGGNGRFLLGMTHFMMMSSYYSRAEDYGLQVDEAGMQMLLRGGLEYDFEIDYWWSQLSDDSRRWVGLHTVRSGTAPARVRALYRLETLPDADNQQIAKQVAQALLVETDEQARMATLQVLGTRAKLARRDHSYTIDTEYRGRMLTTDTRLGIQVVPESEWQDAVYSPEIDMLIAETALDDNMPRVADFAARVIGRMRSTTAVRHIIKEQAEGRAGTLRALALIRDEAPSLPPIVPTQGRLYAWMANTWRRMTDQPLSVVWRYVFALIGAWLGLGFHVYQSYRTESIFTQDRWANTVAMGLVFGVIAGFVAVFAEEFPTRLRRFWPTWGRLLAGFVLGTIIGALAWYSWLWFFLKQDFGYEVLVLGGMGLALGFVLTSLLRLRSWAAIPLTVLLIYLPIFITFRTGAMFENFGPFRYGENFPLEYDGFLLYYDYETRRDLITDIPAQILSVSSQTDTNQEWGRTSVRILPEKVFAVGIPVALLMAVGGHFPLLVRDLMAVAAFLRRLRQRSTRPMMGELVEAPQPVRTPRQSPTPAAIAGVTVANPKLALLGDDRAGRHSQAAQSGEFAVIDEPAPAGTERDVQQGAFQPGGKPELATELDAVQGLKGRGGSDQPAPRLDEDAMEISLKTGEKRKFRNVSYGKGMKLDLSDSSAGQMNTELDPNQKNRSKSVNDDEPPAQG